MGTCQHLPKGNSSFIDVNRPSKRHPLRGTGVLLQSLGYFLNNYIVDLG